MRPKVRQHMLKRPKLRQSWNKYNLFNIARFTARIDLPRRTFFQQKWSAKSMTRSYHGEHINEKRWNRLFSRRLLSAVEMPAKYLAAHDGSEQAAGRGSGRHVQQGNKLRSGEATAADYSAIEPTLIRDKSSVNYTHPSQRSRLTRIKFLQLLSKPISEMTPYMQMSFAPLERRLDVAMFRALFASSPRQARQFCIHGGVTVNGHKMKYGSYLLNPGDMFQVDPDKVMYATGRPKAKQEKVVSANEEDQETPDDAAEEVAEAEAEEAAEESKESAVSESKTASTEEVDLSELPEGEREKEQRRRVRKLAASAKDILSDDKEHLTVKRKQELRAFVKGCRLALSKKTTDVDAMIDDLAAHMTRFKLDGDHVQVNEPAKQERVREDDVTAEFEGLPEEAQNRAARLAGASSLTKDERRRLADLLREDMENPVDPSKPYATPWRPRQLLAPFAFIPRYLEVNQNICAAVYLRHPVARKGLGEVPTPFPYEVNQLAFNWYLRRR